MHKKVKGKKWCSACQKYHNLEDFHKDSYFNDKKCPVCKQKQIEYVRNYYFNNYEYCINRSRITNLFKRRKISKSYYIEQMTKLKKIHGIK